MPPGAEKEGSQKVSRASFRQLGVISNVSKSTLERVTLVKGWFEDTLTERIRRDHTIEKASLIMVDRDIYSASKDALNFCEPHIHKQAVIMFDDWSWREEINEIGQKEAFEEFGWLLISPRSQCPDTCRRWRGFSMCGVVWSKPSVSF